MPHSRGIKYNTRVLYVIKKFLTRPFYKYFIILLTYLFFGYLKESMSIWFIWRLVWWFIQFGKICWRCNQVVQMVFIYIFLLLCLFIAVLHLFTNCDCIFSFSGNLLIDKPIASSRIIHNSKIITSEILLEL